MQQNTMFSTRRSFFIVIYLICQQSTFPLENSLQDFVWFHFFYQIVFTLKTWFLKINEAASVLESEQFTWRCEDFDLTSFNFFVILHHYKYETLCTTWKNVTFSKLQVFCWFTKSNMPRWVFFMFFKLCNGTKSRRAS